MCEALIRVADKRNTDDPYLDSKCLKAGDIVALVPDGWGWNGEELTNPHWRIIKFTNISIDTAAAFLGAEFDADPLKPSKVLRRRAFCFDLANPTLPLAFRNWLADDTRAAPTRTIALTGAQLMTYKKAKVPLVDPNIL